MVGQIEVAEARGLDDLDVARRLCNGFLDWARSRYGERKWIVDQYYPPEKWADMLAQGFVTGTVFTCQGRERGTMPLTQFQRLSERLKGRG